VLDIELVKHQGGTEGGLDLRRCTLMEETWSRVYDRIIQSLHYRTFGSWYGGFVAMDNNLRVLSGKRSSNHQERT
jgi:hypothetical protein